MSQSGYEQAGIEVENKEPFDQLRSVLQRVFSAQLVDRFLRKLESKGLRIRDFEVVLEKKVFEQVDEVSGKSGKSSRTLYEALSVPDQGQMREFYLTQLEAVDLSTREKFAKIYRSY